MAERRMISTRIVDTDEFIDMPISARLLYYELNLRADDDGFVSSPRKIARAAGCSEDDLKILIAKQFILPFKSGIILIRDWKIHNSIRSDRYHETIFVEERDQVLIDPNGRYIQCQTTGIPTVDTGKVRLGKDRLGQDRSGEKNDNAIVPDTAGNNRPLVSFSENPIVTEAMKDYMQLYKKKTRKDHPALKAENYQKVYCFLSDYVSENDLDYGQLTDMMVTYFNNKSLKTDWNINHFATEGILTNRFFEAGLY